MLGLGLNGLLCGLVLAAFLAIRRRWRSAAAREDEVMQLLAMASDETAMAVAEAELAAASIPGGVAPPPPPFHCAVCYCPTTMRCSQCKSVRYWFVLSLSL